jgi:hypothetical protein
MNFMLYVFYNCNVYEKKKTGTDKMKELAYMFTSPPD